MGILIFLDLGGIDKAAKEIVNGLSEKIEEMKKIREANKRLFQG